MPRHDECCREDVDTSGYKGNFVDVGVEEDMIEEKKEYEKELEI